MRDYRRRFLRRSGSLSQRAYGALLLVFGLIAIITPFSAGGWAISILGLILLLAGVVEIIPRPANTIAVFDMGNLSHGRVNDTRRVTAFRPAGHGDWRAAGTHHASHGGRRPHEDGERIQG
jgi:hypothetical protein